MTETKTTITLWNGGTMPRLGMGCWAKSEQALPIPGFRTVAQLEENAGALDKWPLPRAVADEIDAVLRQTAIAA